MYHFKAVLILLFLSDNQIVRIFKSTNKQAGRRLQGKNLIKSFIIHGDGHRGRVVTSQEDILCNKRATEYGYACVCNSTFCDTISTPEKLKGGQFHLYYTSSEAPGFNHKVGSFRMQSLFPHGVKIKVNPSKTFQTIRGFGGAFTDSFGYALNTLSYEAQELLLRSLFSEDGIEYTTCRVALGACDFSLRQYTYAPDYDPHLKSFKLTDDDYLYKINQIRRALQMTKRTIQLFGSTWTPPGWMKTNDDYSRGYIKPEFRQTWADYHVKILDAFKAEGIEFWALTTGNEPITLYQINANIPDLVMFPEEQRDWIIENLGPALQKADYSTKIIILDDQRVYALWYMDTVMRNSEAYNYVHGIGLHWYFDNMVSPTIMDVIHKKYPDQEILYTESSINPATVTNPTGSLKKTRGAFGEFKPSPPNVGSWQRGALFIKSIIENLSHWVSSFVDWNLALDKTGGPNTAHLSCDAAIIINETVDEFYKSPMFYVMGHFSKFMPPGSKIIDLQSVNLKEFESEPPPPPPPSPNVTHPFPIPTTPPDIEIKYIGSLNPDGSTSIIFYNPLQTVAEVAIYDPFKGYAFLVLEPLSISTILYW